MGAVVGRQDQGIPALGCDGRSGCHSVIFAPGVGAAKLRRATTTALRRHRPGGDSLPGGKAAHRISAVKPTPKAPSGGVPRYQLKITLKWSKPPIWRRIVVRGDMSLDRLHNLIQIAMGWTNSHMHQFISGSGFARTYYGRVDPEFGGLGDGMLNEKRYTVADLVPAAKRKFSYEYDFGDSWEHEIVAEKVLPPDPAFKHPVCLEGANACPPEDCGGIPGYYRLLEILADPKHPEYEEMKDWMGGESSEGEFSMEDVNLAFKRLKA